MARKNVFVIRKHTFQLMSLFLIAVVTLLLSYKTGITEVIGATLLLITAFLIGLFVGSIKNI